MGCLVQAELDMDKCYACYSVLKYRANISLGRNDLQLCLGFPNLTFLACVLIVKRSLVKNVFAVKLFDNTNELSVKCVDCKLTCVVNFYKT